jgi:hypothetical protein
MRTDQLIAALAADPTPIDARHAQRLFTAKLCAGAGKAGREVSVTTTGRPTNKTPYPVC